MRNCLFASDLHGHADRYRSLVRAIERESPIAVFLGGDLLPPFSLGVLNKEEPIEDFVRDFLAPEFGDLRRSMRTEYPLIFLILGNDDEKAEEKAIQALEHQGLWIYIHDRVLPLGQYRIYGYSHTPPSPFQLKDWERYDVSRSVDPGCVSPEDGRRTEPVPKNVLRYSTIQKDLDRLARNDNLDLGVFLFHAPPYRTNLDRAALDGKRIDGVPLDVHVGSIAVKRFIESRQPLLTLHGHIHESARLTGSWRDRIGRTHMFGAAHDGNELALIRFDLEDLDAATRDLL